MNKYAGFCILILIVTMLQGCVTVQKAKTAADAFDRKQYFIAASLYEKEFEANSSNDYKAKLAFGAGMSHKLIDETDQAVKWFKEATRYDFGDLAWRELGLAQIQLGQYDDAILTYETFLNKKGNSDEFRLLLSTAKQAQLQARENLNIYMVNSCPVNSAASEYSPSIDDKGNLIVTSDRPGLSATEVYKTTGRGFSDLFISKSSGEVSRFSEDINTTGNEGSSCFNQAGNVMLFTRCALTAGNHFKRKI
jgi:tetratricopeptide (TPR) repeat protein